jgi:hypothetical protein
MRVAGRLFIFKFLYASKHILIGFIFDIVPEIFWLLLCGFVDD